MPPKIDLYEQRSEKIPRSGYFAATRQSIGLRQYEFAHAQDSGACAGKRSAYR
ncbi:hypothetical protein D9M70_382480 [compost metagenome]